MMLSIRPYRKGDRARALEICIAAFTPIHEGFRAMLGEKIFELQYGDWQDQYAATFDRLSQADEGTQVFVAEADGNLVGFVFTILDAARRTGEIGLNAIAPTWQGRGFGKALYDFALDRLKARGAEIAYVGTGNDAAHAPARKAYEAAGSTRSSPRAIISRCCRRADRVPVCGAERGEAPRRLPVSPLPRAGVSSNNTCHIRPGSAWSPSAAALPISAPYRRRSGRR